MAAVPEGHRPRGHRRRRRQGGRARRAPTTARSTTRSSRSTSTSSSRSSTARTPRPRQPRRRCRRRGPRANGWPLEISLRPHRLVHQLARTRTSPAPRPSPARPLPRADGEDELLVTPGSEQTRATIERDGLIADLEAIGATVLANACGPCIGQWDRPTRERACRTPSSTRSTATSRSATTARPTRSRSSPRPTRGGARARRPPRLRPHHRHAHQRRRQRGALDAARRRGAARPAATTRARTRSPPRRPTAAGGGGRPTSDRLQLLEPFAAWDGNDYIGLPVLMKAKGKCTTDHISAAGKWLKYRGHLENISGNLFLGAVNAFNGAVGEGKDQLDGSVDSLPQPRQASTARPASAGCRRRPNYGEGSSREHAAMEPRFRGGAPSSPAASPASTRRT
jgi:aconitate hydratase